MTHQEMAALLNGREYRIEMTQEEEKAAKQNGLVVIFGASDDLAELRGAVHDEVGVCDGGEFFIRDRKVLEMPDNREERVLRKYGIDPRSLKDGAIRIEALWCKEDGYSWTYDIAREHSTFDIMEAEEKYCRGIVFAL